MILWNPVLINVQKYVEKYKGERELTEISLPWLR